DDAVRQTNGRGAGRDSHAERRDVVLLDVRQEVARTARAPDGHPPIDAGDHFVAGIALEIRNTDKDPAGGRRIAGEEALKQGEIGAAEDLDVRAAARPGAGHDVGEAIAVDVAGADRDAAAEAGIEREETSDR